MTDLVVVTPEAKDDAGQGEAFFNSRRDGLGSEFVDEVLATLERIKLTPEGFGEVAPGVRALPCIDSGMWSTIGYLLNTSKSLPSCMVRDTRNSGRRGYEFLFSHFSLMPISLRRP